MFGPDLALRWPREVFAAEVTELTRLAGGVENWPERVELVLEDAFAGPAAADKFRSFVGCPGGIEYLRSLCDRVSELPIFDDRPRYWPERHSTAAQGLDSFAGSFIRLIDELQERGWLEKELPAGCGTRFTDVDVDPAEVLDERLGRPDLWPLRASRPTWDWDLVFGLVEVFHDLVALPRTRRFHQSEVCGWHWSEFVFEPARRIYRWRVNRLLERVGQEVRLADEGDDEGRIVAVTDEARANLLHRAVTRTDPGSGDQVREAIAMFRARSASREARRLAVVALAGVLEQRRRLLKDHLHGKDEGALFEIANRFGLRHQRDGQLTGYDEAFLEWIFWWYLATIELTDRLLARPAP